MAFCLTEVETHLVSILHSDLTLKELLVMSCQLHEILFNSLLTFVIFTGITQY